MFEKIAAVKNHVYNNRAKYAVAATLIGVGYLGIKRGQMWNEFLTEHDLYEAFYAFDEE